MLFGSNWIWGYSRNFPKLLGEIEMKNKILLVLMVGMILLSVALTSASLGTFKQNDCVNIKTIINSTNVTLSTLSYPSGVIAISNKQMRNVAGHTWNYTFCSNTQIGNYVYDYFDADGNVYVNDYDVTPSGNVNNPTFYIIILIISCGVIVFGFAVKNGWMAVLGSFGLVYLGLYTILYGINGIKDTVYTWGFGIILLAAAGYIGIKSAFEMIQDMQ